MRLHEARHQGGAGTVDHFRAIGPDLALPLGDFLDQIALQQHFAGIAALAVAVEYFHIGE